MGQSQAPGKPVARRGRKAGGLAPGEAARLPAQDQEVALTIGNTIRAVLAGGVTTLALAPAAIGAPPSAQSGVSVCNEAASAQKGDLSVGGGTVDPNPPARYLTDRWALGNGNGQGLVNAADNSPALRQCGVPAPPPGDGSGGGVYPPPNV